VIGIFLEPVRDRDHTHHIFCAIQVQRLAEALERYRADCGRYPNVSVGLRGLVEEDTVAGWRGPYIKKVPRDPWGRPFLYLPSGDVLSYGADGKPGGDSVNSDISSHRLDREISDTPLEVRARWLMMVIWASAWVCFFGCIVALRKMAKRVPMPR